MDIKLKNSSEKHEAGVALIIAIVIALAAATVGLYPYMEKKAQDNRLGRYSVSQYDKENFDNLSTQIMNFSYEIWHQQSQEEAGRLLTFSQTFLPGLDDKIRQLENGQEAEEGYGASKVTDNQNAVYYNQIRQMMNDVGNSWTRLYNEYGTRISYAVLGPDGTYLRSNVNKPETVFSAPLSDEELSFVAEFSSNGRLSISQLLGTEDYCERFLPYMSRYEFYDPIENRLSDEYRLDGLEFKGPRDIKIMFRCNPQLVNGVEVRDAETAQGLNGYDYMDSGYVYMIVAIMLVVLMAAALCLPFVRAFEIGRSALCRLSFEPLSCIGAFWLFIVFEGTIPGGLIAATINGRLSQELMRAGFLNWSAQFLEVLINVVFWSVIYGLFYWGITCYRAIFSLGPWRYFKERTWLGRFMRFIKRWVCSGLNLFAQTDWESHSTRIIGKAVVANFVILALISCLWFWGIGALVVYSLVLFFMMKKYWGQMQEKYHALLNAINRIAQGNLEVEVEEDLGIFNPFKEQLAKIQQGLKKAVAQEVKSERTKSELITNVSHDLKTPLTAIITYVNLLKQENITEEERDSYIQVLDQKSMRLKALIEDLFEVSKANSGTVTLHQENVDIISLLKQVRLELSDKIEASGIDFRLQLPGEKVVLWLDSQKTYRIFENLMVNITKYGMPGTRAYIQVAKEPDGYVCIVMRNVSEKELTVSPEELTERFVRGDQSRNTEGSGLGLAIARSFVEVQGGTMKLALEDDLFRVTICWKEETHPEQPEPESDENVENPQ